jgi:chromate transporter
MLSEQPKSEVQDTGPGSLKELGRLFLRLGLTAFGGPAAHIALMQKEVVDKRRWMDHQHFLDLLGATNLIPGPNSTEMAIHIGRERGGGKGLLIAGACFILPAVVITGVIAWLYQRYGHLPQVADIFYGIKPVVIAVIVGAVYPLAKRALKNLPLWIVLATAFALGLWTGESEIAILFGVGIVYALWRMAMRSSGMPGIFVPWLFLQTPAATATNLRIFLSFLKIGAILYGSGYVLFAFLDSELVAKGLLPRQQLVDAIAVGQFTPGPVFSSVTFIGWQMGGWKGAALATIAVFLPSFVFVAALNPLLPLLRRSAFFSAFLDGVNVASVALIGVVCIQFGQDAITDWRTVLIAVAGFVATFGWRKLNSAWVILGGAVLGWVLRMVH